MKRTTIGVAAILAAVAAAMQLPVSGQSAPAPPLVITAFNGGPTPAYTVPRTPWGEPDLQGTWSSDDATFGVSRGGGRGGPPAAGAAPAAPAPLQGLYLNDQQWAERQKTIQQG